jgi:mannose-6-phosphate isomerase
MSARRPEPTPTSVIVLPSNRPADRFYRGGRRITDLRREAPAGPHEPEDWVGSVTAVRGEAPSGMTVLPNGVLLADAVEAAPEHWLGRDHVAAFGADPMLLVKLLDAGQRLPVHAHPDGPWAAAHIGAAHGKTEAWYLLSPGDVHLALARDLPRAELERIVATQDVEALLAAMHRIEAEAGDVVHVPAGVLHAIGEGILLVELQEPEDLSILLEWEGFEIDGAAAGHLGVGFDTALGAVESHARSAEEVAGLVHRAGSATPLLPSDADRYFRVERIVVDGEAALAHGFAILVLIDGQVTITDAAGAATPLSAGATALAPHAAGDLRLSGRGELIVCRPPEPR